MRRRTSVIASCRKFSAGAPRAAFARGIASLPVSCLAFSASSALLSALCVTLSPRFQPNKTVIPSAARCGFALRGFRAMNPSSLWLSYFNHVTEHAKNLAGAPSFALFAKGGLLRSSVSLFLSRGCPTLGFGGWVLGCSFLLRHHRFPPVIRGTTRNPSSLPASCLALSASSALLSALSVTPSLSFLALKCAYVTLVLPRCATSN